MSVDILVFAAHPDDAELNCGGTIAALTARGYSVGIADLTQGEMGTRGTVATRKQEASKASEILGVSFRTNLDLGDSILENDRGNQKKIIKVVREQRPHICIIGAPDDRHPDHSKATALCKDALFYAGLAKFETKNSKGYFQEPWRPKHILHYMQDRPFEPAFVCDITDHWETKKKAILAFNTQFNVSQPGDEPETYISSQKYFKQLEARARYFGHLAGFELGEPFQYLNGPMGLSNLSPLFNNDPAR